MNELENKVVLVTGGAAGIGEAIVRRAARYGAQVAIVDFNLDAAQALAAEVDGSKAYQADVSSADAMTNVCAQVAKDFGGLHAAVNNAGIGFLNTLLDTEPEDWQAMMNVNLTGVNNSLRAELPYLLDNGGGHIVNMASMAGVVTEHAQCSYTAAKHGVVGLTKSVAFDYGRQGIRCNAVCPSMVKTPMTLGGVPPEAWAQIEAGNPTGKLVTPEQVAATTVFLLTEDSAGMTGSAHLVDAGVYAH
jgi:NAD(P)-dependent dehydrogenase (short-subunit alcohol dehydrogenase family)